MNLMKIRQMHELGGDELLLILERFSVVFAPLAHTLLCQALAFSSSMPVLSPSLVHFQP